MAAPAVSGDPGGAVDEAGEADEPEGRGGGAPVAEPEADDESPRRAWLLARLDRLLAVGAWIRATYFVVDVRTAGLFRIALGGLCAADTIRHWANARWAYSNSGVLTNHWHLFRPSSGYNFSVYHAFSTIGEVHVAFALSVLCHLLLCVGWHARLFSVVTCVLMTSLDNRLVMVENGGYVVVNLLCFYAMFLPTDRRFSVDALRRSYRERKERGASGLNERYRPAWAHAPYVSGIGLLVVLNLGALYIFNVVNKSGETWRQGRTVHYVLWLNRMVTGLAVFFREHTPYVLLAMSGWAVLVLEALLICWILTPYARRLTRPMAIVGMWVLHGTFGVMMRLGPFSWFLLVWSTLLLAPEQWDQLEAWFRRRARPQVVAYDPGSPLAFALCRLLARLDGLELLRFELGEAGAPGAPPPPLLVVRDEQGTASDGLRAFDEVAQALPGGGLVRVGARLLTVGLLGPLLAAVSRRREGVARFFGLSLEPSGSEARDEPSPLAVQARSWRSAGREAFLLFFAMCAFSQSFHENVCFPERIEFTIPEKPWFGPLAGHPVSLPFKWPQWRFVEATIGYPRLYQGWGMFAPNPITDDGSLTVEAWTKGGRRVDPFTGQEPDLDLTDARGLGLGQIRQDYFNRIRFDRNKVFRQGLSEYLQRWHLETGHPEDELVAFDVYWVRDQCPVPPRLFSWDALKVPHAQPYKNEKVAILTWRKPGYQPPPGAPPIPPEPKVESAGN